MRYLSYLTTLLIAVLLTACGGGGGSAGTSSGSAPSPVSPPAALFTTAPASLTVGVGAAQEFIIGGGTSPYTAVSNNASIAIAGVKDTRLTLGGVADGTAQITIRDAAGATVLVEMVVSSGPVRPLYTTATSSITVAPGLSGAQTYNVGGGASPYTATSSNVSVASVVLTGNSLTVTGLSAGSTNIVIMDNLGATVTVAVTVPTASSVALFSTAPSSVTVAIGASPAYSVGGGTSPYTATSSNTSVVAVSLSGSNLTVNGVAAGNANIVVRDSAGGTVNIAVTVSAAQMTLNPVTVNAFIGDTVYSTISGGKVPYTTVNGFPDAADVDIGTLSGSTFTANSSGNILRIKVKQAVASDIIVVRDANGASANFTLSASPGTNRISLSPSALTISELGSYNVTLTLYGGVGTVNLFSSDTSLLTVASPVTASTTGTTVTVTKPARCLTADAPVTITAIDSTGAQATSVFTIKDSLSTPSCP